MRSGTIAFLAGVILLQLFPRLPGLAWCLLPGCLIVAALYTPRLRLAAWAAGGFLWAMLHASWALGQVLPAQLEGRDVQARGVIASIPEPLERRIRFDFQIEVLEQDGTAIAPTGKVRLNWYGEAPQLHAGDRWQLRLRLKRPRGYRNPGGFDYERKLLVEGVRAVGYVRSDAGNRRLGSALLTARVHRVRQSLRDALQRTLDGSPYAGLLTGLAIGHRSSVSPEQWETLRRTGTTHLLAISGLHVGMIAAVMFVLVRRGWPYLPLLGARLPAASAAAVAALAAALAYAVLAGLTVPTQRAFVMVGAVLLAGLLHRHTSPGRVLSLALLLVLLYDPGSVLVPGFWLSFAAAGILLFGMAGRISAAATPWRQWGRAQWLVTVGLAPALLLLFGRLPLLGMPANLVAVPWMTLTVVPLTVAGTALLPVSEWAAQGLLWVAEKALAVLWQLLDAMAAVPGADWQYAIVAPWTIVPAAAGVLWLLAPRGWPARWLGLAGLLPMLLTPAPVPAPGAVWLTLLDVGQGLSAVVRTRHSILVFDTGPRVGERFDTGRVVVVPFLRHQGVRRVDRLVISHGDNDHVGGARSLAEAVPVTAVLASDAAGLDGLEHIACRKGQAWESDGVQFEVLHPDHGYRGSANNRSCVLHVRSRYGSLLLTGDIESAAEAEMLAVHGDRLGADVLIAPHHGSRTSSTSAFLAAVRPTLALFPVGYLNRYGLPAPTVLARYRALGIATLTTSDLGAISVRLGPAGDGPGVRGFVETGARYWWSRPE